MKPAIPVMINAYHRVCAIIVTFNPDLSMFTRLLEALAGQVPEIIIVDNGSQAETRTALEALARGPARRHLILQDVNRGLADAQNRGIRRAMTLHATHVILFDQDSIPAADMVRQLLRVEQALLAKNIKPGAVGPTPVDRRTATRAAFVRRRGWFIRRCHPGRDADWVETDFLIASGSLISIDALRDIGLMADGYFIDHVDTEWCFRATHRGYRLFGAAKAILHHCLGDEIVKVWFLRWREVPQHSPARGYYICRNTLHMVFHTPMCVRWRCMHLYRLLKFLAFFLITGKARGQRRKMILLGLKDGLRGVQGMLDGPE